MDGTEIKIFRNKNCLIFFEIIEVKKNSMISSFLKNRILRRKNDDEDKNDSQQAQTCLLRRGQESQENETNSRRKRNSVRSQNQSCFLNR